jgi:hypothetical protein
MFNNILAEEKLKFDRDNNRRTAYSPRHTYICFRLMEGADIYQIAKNCRTSVEMIEKHYAAHIKTALDTSAINIRRDRPRSAKQQEELAKRAKDDHSEVQDNNSAAPSKTSSALSDDS